MSRDPSKPGSTPDRPIRAAQWGRPGSYSDELTTIRLIRKYADVLDGIDLERAAVGDWIELPWRAAAILIAEGWAEREDHTRPGRLGAHREMAADRPDRRKKPRN